MSETRKPVWVWLPGNAEPVQCGQFSLHDKVGSFEYLSDYRDRPDDHPRNHGIVHVEGHWCLSPAFDIAPYITYSGTQAMAMTRSGSSMASRANLLSDCASFGLDRTQAEAFIDHAVNQLPVLWQQKAQALGFEVHEVPAPQASLWL